MTFEELDILRRRLRDAIEERKKLMSDSQGTQTTRSQSTARSLSSISEEGKDFTVIE